MRFGCGDNVFAIEQYLTVGLIGSSHADRTSQDSWLDAEFSADVSPYLQAFLSFGADWR
jgi:hypothetical protein